MKTKAVEREKVGLLLASGYTKKEVASILGKSIHTITMQTRRLFIVSKSRNVADLTRFMIKRYCNIPVEEILFNALHDLSLILAGAILFYIFSQPESQVELMSAFDSIINTIREQLSGWFTKPTGNF